MAYVLVLLAALGIFVYSTPARQAVKNSLAAIAQSAEVRQAETYLRDKVTGFIRTELHHAVDDAVK
ncbi:MAG TPA: hypothetical protein VMU12_00550 [Candidatus Paceibacterota bacterium]|nr:hypothetical protein [Candidatus Paceibacterota bacterium]